MVGQGKVDALKTVRFFKGLTDQELDEVSKICGETSFTQGQLCQAEGQEVTRIHLIVKGKVGSVTHIPNVLNPGNEIIMEIFGEGDMFGWSSLMKGPPSWPAIRTLEPVEALYVNAEDLLNLCERNNQIGYIVMRNLSSLIASRLRQNRMSILNVITAIRGS